jgi:hypothetical protein
MCEKLGIQRWEKAPFAPHRLAFASSDVRPVPEGARNPLKSDPAAEWIGIRYYVGYNSPWQIVLNKIGRIYALLSMDYENSSFQLI